MNKLTLPSTGSGLRQRLIEDMSVRGFSKKTQRDYIRNVASFAAFLGRSPDTATAEDIRRFQIHQSEQGMHPPAMNSTVAALRFFFTHTARPAGYLSQAHTVSLCAQTTDRIECGRSGTAAGCHQMPQASCRPCCCLWRGPAGRRGGLAQNGRYRQRPHADPR
jgi:hypothetical protein